MLIEPKLSNIYLAFIIAPDKSRAILIQRKHYWGRLLDLTHCIVGTSYFPLDRFSFFNSLCFVGAAKVMLVDLQSEMYCVLTIRRAVCLFSTSKTRLWLSCPFPSTTTGEAGSVQTHANFYHNFFLPFVGGGLCQVSKFQVQTHFLVPSEWNSLNVIQLIWVAKFSINELIWVRDPIAWVRWKRSYILGG